MLIEGTIKNNLDIFNNFSDNELIDRINEVLST
jgi:hypothetical protein